MYRKYCCECMGMDGISLGSVQRKENLVNDLNDPTQ